MDILRRSGVWRGGSFGNRVTKENPLPAVGTASQPSTSEAGAVFHFQMPAGGRGNTDVTLWISPADFEAVAHAMVGADPVSARRAFGAALVADADTITSEDD